MVEALPSGVVWLNERLAAASLPPVIKSRETGWLSGALRDGVALSVVASICGYEYGPREQSAHGPIGSAGHITTLSSFLRDEIGVPLPMCLEPGVYNDGSESQAQQSGDPSCDVGGKSSKEEEEEEGSQAQEQENRGNQRDANPGADDAACAAFLAELRSTIDTFEAFSASLRRIEGAGGDTRAASSDVNNIHTSAGIITQDNNDNDNVNNNNGNEGGGGEPSVDRLCDAASERALHEALESEARRHADDGQAARKRIDEMRRENERLIEQAQSVRDVAERIEAGEATQADLDAITALERAVTDRLADLRGPSADRNN